MINSYKKILIIQTAFIGDLIVSTPVFRELRKNYPDVQIDVVVIPSSSIILNNNPHINNIYSFNKKSGLLNKFNSFNKLVSELRHQNYDLGLSLQNSRTSSAILNKANVEYKVGANNQKGVEKCVEFEKGLHSRLKMLKFLETINIPVNDDSTEIHLSEEELKLANRLIKTNNSIKIGIAPGSVRETKKWRKESFVKLIDLLDSSKYEIYLFGSSNEYLLTEAIKSNSKNIRITNFAGKLNLLQSAALIDKMDLMLTNDSAPLHISNAMKTDVFAFFGPTVKEFGFFPFRSNDYVFEVDLDCRPCGLHGGKKCPLKHHNCMKFILPEEVMGKIEKKFEGGVI